MALTLVWSLLLLLQAAVHSASCQSSCYSGRADIEDYPLPNDGSVHYLQPFNRSQGRQVLVPQMRFDCAGYITGWSAHTLVVTRPNFLDLLTHIITFQVWRPGPTNRSYSLVGSNRLAFSGENLRNNITTIPGRTDVAYFSFEETIEQREQIYFLPGDVIGWFIPFITTTSPLSPLFRDPTPQDCDDVIANMWYKNSSQQECTLCDFTERAEVVTSTVPLVAVTAGTFGLDNTCVQTGQACEATTPLEITTATTPLPEETTPINNQEGQNQQEQLPNTFTVAETVCIVLASVTLLLHVVMVVLCGVNLTVMKQIRGALHTRTVPITPGIRSPSTNFKLGAISPISPHKIKSETPADYEAVMSGYDNVTRLPQDEVEFNDESSDKMASMTSLNKHMVNSKAGSLASINKQLSDSRTGSREDLLRLKQPRQDLV